MFSNEKDNFHCLSDPNPFQQIKNTSITEKRKQFKTNQIF